MITGSYGYNPREALKELQQEGARAAERQRELERGMGLLGYHLDLQGVASGRIGPFYPPTWRRTRAPSCPPGLPTSEWTAATAAADGREAALAAQAEAHQAAERDTTELPTLLRATEYQRATYRQDRALEAAEAALLDAARRLAQVVAAVAHRAAVQASAPAQRAAADRVHQAAHAAIDAQLAAAEQALADLGLVP